MDFQATPTNMTELLVVVLGGVAAMFLMMKRYNSNLPLIFYFIAVVFTNATDRTINPYLLYSGLAFALLGRLGGRFRRSARRWRNRDVDVGHRAQ